jgi:hypothetical protein
MQGTRKNSVKLNSLDYTFTEFPNIFINLQQFTST